MQFLFETHNVDFLDSRTLMERRFVYEQKLCFSQQAVSENAGNRFVKK